ncbi:hypothetical protein HAX54_023610 [Datura stramonium]|uniref:Uncharacterized protein n=1 Tax=Datura stramonium TaxID=4076 RepID=A0ABS8UWT4_DATST|nr:hypothetical protein [Datura stramonium]
MTSNDAGMGEEALMAEHPAERSLDIESDSEVDFEYNLPKGPYSQRYAQQPYNPSASPKMIPKRFRMSDILKYDEIPNLIDHILVFTSTVKGDNLIKDKIKFILVKKFGRDSIQRNPYLVFSFG